MYVGFPLPGVKLLIAVKAGPVGQSHTPSIELISDSGILQSDPSSPLLFNAVTIFLIYCFKSFKMG